MPTVHRLPQKSGFPQEKINEIHGAWFDPSNPVVQFGGHLRGDLFDWMAEAEKVLGYTQLFLMCICSKLICVYVWVLHCLVWMQIEWQILLRSSLSKSPPKLWVPSSSIFSSMFLLCFQWQEVLTLNYRTPLDSHSVVRVWAKLDDAFTILAKKLNLPKIRPFPATLPSGDVFEIPYDSTGKKNDSVRMTLDLRIVCLYNIFSH